MKIIIQSYVDIITNSSTSVFTWANNTNGVKSIINGVLKAAGSEFTVDDLFDIKIEYNISLSDTDGFYIEKLEELVKEDDLVLQELKDRYDNIEIQSSSGIKWSEYEALEEEIYNVLTSEYGIITLDEYAENHNMDCDEWKYSSNYTFIAKDPTNQAVAECLSCINELFSYDACYC